MENDQFFYAEREDSAQKASSNQDKWKVMIVDDEKEVHEVTDLTLRDFACDGKGIELIHAYSGKMAKALMEENPDTALILLDVVMETDEAGLDVVQYIRETMNNHFVRIILRTGQPGMAPEKKIIQTYDINDYKEKSDLTIQKLFTTMFSSIRSYRDIKTIYEGKRGLERILMTSSALFELQSMEHLVSNLLRQLVSILGMDEKSVPKGSGILINNNDADFRVLAGFGVYEDKVGTPASKSVKPDVLEKIKRAQNEKKNVFPAKNECVVYFKVKDYFNGTAYLTSPGEFKEWDMKLVEIFCANACIAFDNVYLYNQINVVQESAIMSLAKLAEFKDAETGDHIQRVSLLVSKIVERLHEKRLFEKDIDAVFVQQIGIASILHDVGKVGIPERILLKAQKPTAEEWEIIKKHPVIGGKILQRAAEKLGGKNYINLAADIALYHHEKYNGKGYPDGIKGDEIPISARIVSVVDVYDALISRRPYKEPVSQKDALDYIKKEAGKSFDPHVVDALLFVLMNS